MAADKILRLILGDQLNTQHRWYKQKSGKIVYLMMEMRQETDYVKHHIQKVAGFFSAMRHFAQWLSRQGHTVRYYYLDDPINQQDLEQNIRALVKKEKFTRFEYLLPDEYRLDNQLKKLAERLPIPVVASDSEHFLTSRDTLKQQFKGKKRYLMESFYRRMRKQYDILMVDAKPEGGKWNYDQSNRNRYDGKVPIPPEKVFKNDVTDIVKMIDAAGVLTFGSIDPKHLPWPVTRRQSLAQVKEFMNNRLAHFGTYQDAMSTESGSLFHSRLSFALNTKMVHPMEVIRAAIDTYQKDPAVKIEQVEGFVRQILGWREYMRGIYWAQMPSYEKLNFFDHKKALPDYYWTAETGMKCISAAVNQSLENAYAHHIQRLMVTGNFALLAGIHPDMVDAWYLGIYIDAVQWVELINTRGMSQYADGGMVATKPYVSSAKYIRKMSDYCDNCRYNWKESTGEGACPFNSMYWDFLDRHRKKLERNFRMAMMYRTWDRMDETKRKALIDQAARYRKQLNAL